MILLGRSSQPYIKDVKIDNNKGPGIKVGIGCLAEILKCVIQYNACGIEIVSANPLITQNTIEKNY